VIFSYEKKANLNLLDSGYNLIAYGWGDMGNGEKPSELHKLPLKHMTDKACLAIMGDRITDTMMCAGDPNKAHGTCKV
jgi:hypothetical protein